MPLLAADMNNFILGPGHSAASRYSGVQVTRRNAFVVCCVGTI